MKNKPLIALNAEGDRILFLLAAVLWIGIIGGSFLLNRHRAAEAAAELALVEARSSFQKDLIYRRWATIHGGVYVPPADHTPPNPYLAHIPERDVVTADGKRLTLVNPAYMTRQVHELGRETYGVRGHITSLYPIRPENGPDAWETEALKAFHAGTKEVSSFSEVDGRPYLRFMRPMVTEVVCLKCHSEQGYRPGDIRGGISVSVPFAPYQQIAGRQQTHIALSHGVIGCLGLLGLWIGRRFVIQSRAALREREEWFRILFEEGPDAVFIETLDDRVLDANAAASDLLGYTREAFKEMTVADLQAPNVRKAVGNIIQNELAGGDFFEGLDIRKDGTRVPVEVHNRRMRIQGRDLVVSIVRDITERKRAENALRESETRFRDTFEQAAVGMAHAAPDGRFILVNNRLCEILGYSREELLGLTWQEITYPGDLETDLAHVRRLLNQKIHTYSTEKRYLRRDGTFIWIHLTVSLVCDGAGKPEYLIGVAEDISARKQAEAEKMRLETQVRQIRKLDSIGRLAGGVAHDLNNLLSPILGYGEMLLEDAAGTDTRRGPVEEIVSAGRRARDLVRQLLAFSRKQTLEVKSLNLNHILNNFQSLLRRTIREDIVIRMIPAPDLPPIRGDIGQLEQVLMNLAVNAQDAMPDGGELTIETQAVELDASYAKRHTGVAPGAYVMLGVSDTGCGMDADTREQVFEPFFSTKDEKGTGLGLATVYGIVKQHHGNIWVYSEPGMGATFKVYLPVSDESPGAEKPPVSGRAASNRSGTETILLVEDNRQVRDLAEIILKREGYSVLTAESGHEALAVLDIHDGVLHLLLTDVVMPGMNGRELYQQVADRYPEVKVVYMSGYTDNVIAHRGVMDSGIHFIQKPFSVKDLAAKVQDVLDEDRGRS